MHSVEFWRYFESQAAPRLAVREPTFRKVFEYLDARPGPLTIVETGCARQADNWAGDGQSTVLFDQYIRARDQVSECMTVDINPSSVQACRQLVSSRVAVTEDDSVHFLWELSRDLDAQDRTIDLLYLDSFDLDMVHWTPSAIHHLKELTAAMRCIDEHTLVVVDDCPLSGSFIPGPDGGYQLLGNPRIGGKGRLVAEFAEACGAHLEFAQYQAGWTGFC